MTEHEARLPVVLLADDNPSKRYSISRLLRASGFQVTEATCGQEALDLAAAGPDAIVLDVNLPDIDGYEVCRILRTRGATARTPLIHLSATFIEASDKVLGLDAGADGYLTHPVEPPVLVATLRAFLRARQAEDRMRKSDARFAAIFQHVPSGIALLDDDLNFVEANPAISRMLGINASLLAGRPWDAQTTPGALGDAQDLRARLAREGEAHGEIETVRGDGEVIQLEWRISSHSEPGWLACASEVTERRRVEAQRDRLLASERAARTEAERANRSKDEFLATISHELRSPLQAIIGWAQLLESGRLHDARDVQSGVAAISRNARIQARLVSDLLDVSRITSGKLHLERAHLDMGPLVAQAVDGARMAATAKRIRLLFEPATGRHPVEADASRLHQVLSNLLTNAIKFTPEGGSVNIRLEDRGEWVDVTVADDGFGISPDFLPHLFDRFRQQDAATTRQHEGLGLGLAIAKRLVELHGGTITASSAGLGSGSSFTVRLPRSLLPPLPDDASDAMARSQRPGREVLRGLRVMIVDDDAGARSFVKRLLDEHQAVTSEADSVAAAMAQVEAANPQLLISDISMPSEDGFELLRRLRAAGFDAARLPAVALTAFAHPEDRERVLASGFQLHLAKPIELETLLGALVDLIGPRLGASPAASAAPPA